MSLSTAGLSLCQVWGLFTYFFSRVLCLSFSLFIFYFLNEFFKLGYNCLTILYQFLLYNKVNQFCIYTYPVFVDFQEKA